MRLQQLREWVTMLSRDARAEREHLADALQSMDYEQALSCQQTLDRLEGELFRASSRLAWNDDHRDDL
jgi:hypothetical protein